ncbi:hypothetical protein AUK22_00890 [bacterium CG2_30_54_10]|nr:MAG: hypothetical protein AUK22_00890 [bacterium CG2_30_54_10]
MSGAKNLNLFTTTWCPHCLNLLAWLDQEGIGYTNHDVDQNDLDWKTALSLTGGIDVVPVAEIDGKAVWGVFNEKFRARIKVLMG